MNFCAHGVSFRDPCEKCAAQYESVNRDPADWAKLRADAPDVRYPSAEEQAAQGLAVRIAGARPGATITVEPGIYAIAGNTFIGTQTISTAPVPTPFPETEAFHQLLQDMAAGEVSIRDGLMRAYEAGRAERAAA